MAHGRPRDPRKGQHGRRLIQQGRHSGLSVRAFCDRHQLTPPTFSSWRRLLRLRDASAACFVPVQVVPDREPGLAGGVDVVLAGGRRLRVAPGFDPDTLRQLLALLEEAPPC
jgi:hypothetical protein